MKHLNESLELEARPVQPKSAAQTLAWVRFDCFRKLIQAILREKILPSYRLTNNLLLSLGNHKEGILIQGIEIAGLYQCINFEKVLLRKSNGETTPIYDPLELLRLVKKSLLNKINIARWDNFTEEIIDHLQKALAIAQESDYFNQKIKYHAKRKNYHSLIPWVDRYITTDNKTLFFEQWVSSGHPYHPCSKTKLGFSEDDLRRYSPEFRPVVQLPVFAVRKECVHIELLRPIQDYKTWFAQEYPATWQQWQKCLATLGLKENHFIPMPAHPWQATHVIDDALKDLFAANKIIRLENVYIKASPTLSFRTLASLDGTQHASYIKLSMAIQATSAFRTISPCVTVSTPRISHVFSKIMAREHNFDGRLSILKEVCGLHLTNLPEEQAKLFTTIYRENPNKHLNKNEIAIVLAALFEKSPVSKHCLFIEIMLAAGTNSLKDAVTYFKHYVERVLRGYLDLYLLYGVALEAHQQNVIAVYCNGNLERFISRDFNGELYIDANALSANGYSYERYPGAAHLSRSRNIVRRTLLHSVYQSHLGELVLLLAKHFSCDENVFWQVIKNATVASLKRCQGRMDPDIWVRDQQAILMEAWPCKALLRMRLLENETPEGCFLTTRNPLATCDNQ